MKIPFLGCPSVIDENIFFPWGLCYVQGLLSVFSNFQCIQLLILRGNPGKVELWFLTGWHHRSLGPSTLKWKELLGSHLSPSFKSLHSCTECYWIWPGEVSPLLPFILTSHSLLLRPFIYSLTLLAPPSLTYMVLHDMTYVFAFHSHDLSLGYSNVNLTQAKVIWEEGTSEMKKLPLQDQAGGELTEHFLNYWLLWECSGYCVRAIHRFVILHSIRKWAVEAIKEQAEVFYGPCTNAAPRFLHCFTSLIGFS